MRMSQPMLMRSTLDPQQSRKGGTDSVTQKVIALILAAVSSPDGQEDPIVVDRP